MVKTFEMSKQEAIAIIKQVCDGAIKAGLISKLEDAALLAKAFEVVSTGGKEVPEGGE